jgi:flagellar basal-body rod protein FlgB
MEVIGLVEKALDIRAHYHKVLAGNIANVDTPHYKEKDINFNKELESKLLRTQDIKIIEKTEQEGAGSIDGNTVNMENQIVKVTENNLFFNSLVHVVTKKLSAMRYAINEGRR